MVFAFLAGLAYDLEPLAAGAGHKKSGGGSNRGDEDWKILLIKVINSYN
jgi:hypothetical protein